MGIFGGGGGKGGWRLRGTIREIEWVGIIHYYPEATGQRQEARGRVLGNASPGRALFGRPSGLWSVGVWDRPWVSDRLVYNFTTPA
jgi:hypothetical protein